jgi:hypothetical protein
MDIMFDNAQLADYGTVCNKSGIPFSQNEYMMLRTAAAFAMLKYGNKEDSNGKSRGLLNGIYARKSRARIFRLHLDNSGSGSEINQLRTVKTFFELISLDVPENMVCSELNSVWSVQSLPNSIRMFCFQFVNNSLPTGPRLAGRYRANPEVIIDERCVFCVKAGVGVPARETFCHLFFDCDSVRKCVTAYLNKYGNANWGDVEKKRFMFTGTIDMNARADTRICQLQNLLFFYRIWMCRKQCKIPAFCTVEVEMLTIFDLSVSLSTSLRELASTGNCFISRLWRERHGRG